MQVVAEHVPHAVDFGRIFLIVGHGHLEQLLNGEQGAHVAAYFVQAIARDEGVGGQIQAGRWFLGGWIARCNLSLFVHLNVIEVYTIR